MREDEEDGKSKKSVRVWCCSDRAAALGLYGCAFAQEVSDASQQRPRRAGSSNSRQVVPGRSESQQRRFPEGARQRTPGDRSSLRRELSTSVLSIYPPKERGHDEITSPSAPRFGLRTALQSAHHSRVTLLCCPNLSPGKIQPSSPPPLRASLPLLALSSPRKSASVTCVTSSLWETALMIRTN